MTYMKNIHSINKLMVHSVEKLVQPPRFMESSMHKVKIDIVNNHVNKYMSKKTDRVERP